VYRRSLQFTDISISVQISVMWVLQICSKHAVCVKSTLYLFRYLLHCSVIVGIV
jgi:hypothetical protein